MISVENLEKRFDTGQVLHDLSLTVPDGSIYALIGANGAGKTTVIRHLAGILKEDAGTITYDGEPVWENPSLKARIGLIPDELWFPRKATLKDMSRLYGGLYAGWDPARFHELTQLFHLREDRSLSIFSKGMTKQAAFTLVMAERPDYLLLDEPIDGLDPIVRRLVWRTIVDDVADRGMTVLVSSHNLKEMEDICDRVGILDHGRTLLERDLAEIRDGVTKVQIAFTAEDQTGWDRLNEALKGTDVLQMDRQGSLGFLIIRGKESEVRSILSPLHPAVLDIIPLTLEDIFIYELGGENDDIKKLLF